MKMFGLVRGGTSAHYRSTLVEALIASHEHNERSGSVNVYLYWLREDPDGSLVGGSQGNVNRELWAFFRWTVRAVLRWPELQLTPGFRSLVGMSLRAQRQYLLREADTGLDLKVMNLFDQEFRPWKENVLRLIEEPELFHDLDRFFGSALYLSMTAECPLEEAYWAARVAKRLFPRHAEKMLARLLMDD